MDKTLEVIMVAVALVVAAVIVVSLLQGRTQTIGTFADNQTNSSACGIAKSNFCRASSGTGTPPAGTQAGEIAKENSHCAWSSGAGSTDASSICG